MLYRTKSLQILIFYNNNIFTKFYECRQWDSRHSIAISTLFRKIGIFVHKIFIRMLFVKMFITRACCKNVRYKILTLEMKVKMMDANGFFVRIVATGSNIRERMHLTPGYVHINIIRYRPTIQR